MSFIDVAVNFVIPAVAIGTVIGCLASKKYHILFMILFLVFAGLTANFYTQSIVPLNKTAAQYLGVDNVMNLQATIYASACAIVAALCLIGFSITKELNE